MASIVSGLTPGFNTKMDKLLVVSAYGIYTYVGSGRRQMRFCKYKMVEVQGIEPWSERIPYRTQPVETPLHPQRWGHTQQSVSVYRLFIGVTPRVGRGHARVGLVANPSPILPRQYLG